MDGSIRLSAKDRKMLLHVYRGSGSADVARRAHVLLLLGEGWTYRQVMEGLFASAELVATVKQRYAHGGVTAVLGAGSESSAAMPAWSALPALWLLSTSPRDFGYYRSRWSCEALAEVLAWETGIRRSGETIRRLLRRQGFVWRRPRPVLGPKDSEYTRKLKRIRQLLETVPENETVVFQDEVDIHLNPKIGSCWMLRGEQAEVVTPGNNVKRHLAGSLHWRTGTLLISPSGPRRNAELFLAHLDDLRRQLRGYTKIHVVCDNAAFHNCRRVREYLARWGHRIELHFLPTYAPETNPIERVWWRLHEAITRNHRCTTLDELLSEVYAWCSQQNFYTQSLAEYRLAA